jgi:hypothetical protein
MGDGWFLVLFDWRGGDRGPNGEKTGENRVPFQRAVLPEEGAAEGGGFGFGTGVHREAGDLGRRDGGGCGKPANRAFSQRRAARVGVKAFLKVVEAGANAEDVCPTPPEMDEERVYPGERGGFERV